MHRDLSNFLTNTLLCCCRSRTETWDGGIIHCEENACEIEVLDADAMGFRHVPDCGEGSVGILFLEVDGAEGQGFDVVPVILIGFVGSPTIDALLVSGAIG